MTPPSLLWPSPRLGEVLSPLAIGLSIALVAGCGASEGRGVEGEVIQGVGALVRDVDHQRLLDAEVIATGSRNITDASGHLVFDDELPGLFSVIAELEGYTRTGSGPPVEVDRLSATLLALAPTEAVEGGARVSFGDVELELPDGSLLDDLGQPFTGTWTLHGLVATGDDRWAAPGEALLRYDDVLDKPIHPLHPIYLQGRDEEGNRLDLTDEAGALLRFTLPAGSPVQTDWRLIAYSMGSQRWSRGQRVVVDGGLVEVALPRFGWVAFGQEDEPRGCVQGSLLTDDGQRADGGEVRLLEDGPAGAVRGWVEGGSFCVPMTAGTSGELRALWYDANHQRVGMAVQTVTHDGGAADCGGGGGSCVDVGGITLEVGRDLDGDNYFGGPGGDCDDTDESINPSVAYGDGSWCGDD